MEDDADCQVEVEKRKGGGVCQLERSGETGKVRQGEKHT